MPATALSAIAESMFASRSIAKAGMFRFLRRNLSLILLAGGQPGACRFLKKCQVISASPKPMAGQ